MVTKESYTYYASLLAYFGISALTCLTVILTVPSASLIGIFLQGLLIALGATGYGFLVFGCVVVAGLLAVGLGLLAHYIIRAFQSKSQKLQDNNILILGTEMEQKTVQNFPETEPLLSQIEEEDITEGKSITEEEVINKIENLKQWGKAIAKTLYGKTLSGEEKEVEEILKSNLEILGKDYKRLALVCHPDREFDISQKKWKTEAFQELGQILEITRKCWELALCGINPEEPGVMVTDIDGEKIRLLKEQNELLKENIRILEETIKKIDIFFSEENVAKIRARLKADIEADRNSPSFFESMWQSACSTASNMYERVIQPEQPSTSDSIELEEIEQESRSLILETNIKANDSEAVIITEVKDHTNELQETGLVFWADQKATELKESVCSKIDGAYESVSSKLSSLWGYLNS